MKSFFLCGFTSSFHTSYLGNVYIADSYNHRIRKVTISSEIITTIAGTGTSSYSGDNGPATSATLNHPAGVALDSVGSHSFFKNYFFICFNLSSIR
jgi:DNA-binding beta-propeller fold protein YncE